MNDQNLKELIKELKEEGALKKEAEDLTLLSKNLLNLYSFERSPEFKTRFLEQELLTKNKFFVSRQVLATAFLSLILLLGFTSVVGAQNSLPGQPLYPVKKLSENVISFIKPDFKDEILKRRSEEIKELSGKKDGDNFQSLVNEYEKELDENKKINSKKIEEAQKNLKEARKNSLDEHKEDIERVIIKTENRQGESEKEDEEGRLNFGEDNTETNDEDNRNSEDRPEF